MNVIALDAGQTGIRAQLRVDDVVVREVETPGVLTDRPVVPQLAAVVAAVEPLAGTTLAVGSSGLGSEITASELLDHVRDVGITRVLLAHDSITSYLGALGDEPGVVIASGTGVVTLAVGADSLARVDGWGHLIGDAGSGFWIGRAAFDAVLRAHDGRGPATALTDAIRADFPDLEDAYLVLQADTSRVSRIASWARTVAELASTDAVARRICEQAADELAASVIAGLTRVGQANRPDPLVSTLGKVFHGEVLADEFARVLRDRFPELRLVAPAGTGLDGAAAMASLSASSPFWQRISSS